MSDLVLNHCSVKSKWFENFLKNRTPGKGYFIEPNKGFDATNVVRPRSSDLLQVFRDRLGKKRALWCTFSGDQVDLDYSNPEVLKEVCRILRFYIDNGVRYFRLIQFRFF